MKLWRMILALGLCLGLGLSTAKAQEAQSGSTAKPAEGGKELKFAGTPYVYTGPDTGFGVGFSIMFRDLFGKVGRDVTYSMSYTQSMYQSYSLDWGEPYFLSPNGRGRINLSYEAKPAIRFYGLGNDSDIHDLCNWSWTKIQLQPQYIYRWPSSGGTTYGLRASIYLKFVDPEDGKLEDKASGDFNRKVSRIFPDFFRSDQFGPANLFGVGVVFYRDTRVDRFPLGGGREEIVWPKGGGYEEIAYDRYDEAIGSDFTFNRLSLDVRRFYALGSDDTILALHGKIVVTQGNVPFHEMPSYGNGNDLRGYFGLRFVGRDATQFNIELRQGFFPNWELPILNGLIKLKYPSVFLFWDEARVYRTYTNIPKSLFEDYHWTWGGGFRFVITPSVVIRLEWGNSDEQSTFSANAGLPF